MPKGKPRRHRHKYGVVYRVTHLATGMVYIGQTRHTYPTTRWRTHIQQAKLGHTTPLHADIREHGEEAFEFLPIACVWPRGYIDELEKILIDQYQAIASGYNTNYGSTYRPKPPEPDPPWTPEREAAQRVLEAREALMEQIEFEERMESRYTTPAIIINDRTLTEAEANTLRVAVTALHSEMSDPLHLGDDDHGRAMVAAYRRNCEQILRLLGVIG